MSDNSAVRSRSTNIDISVANRYAKSRSKSRDRRDVSDKSSVISECDVNDLRQDINNLIQLANQINDKIIKSRTNLSYSFVGDDEMVNTVKCITESFQSINLFIKEDNINMKDIPEFSELSLKISKLKALVSINQNLANNPDSRNQESEEITVSIERTQQDANKNEAPSKSKKSNSSKNCFENDMSIRNMVMNEVYLEDNDLMEQMDLRTPLLEKEENSSFNSHSKYYQHYSTNGQKHSSEPYRSNSTSSNIETIGLSIFLALLILVVILYIVS